jgi:hypothetical protein
VDTTSSDCDEGYISVVGVVAGNAHTLVAGSDGHVYGFGLGRAYGETMCDNEFDDDGRFRFLSCRYFRLLYTPESPFTPVRVMITETAPAGPCPSIITVPMILILSIDSYLFSFRSTH